MSELSTLRQQIAQMQREHFREMADLRERVSKLERENRALASHIPEARELITAWDAKGGTA